MKPCYDIIAEQPFFQGLSQAHLRTLAESAMQTGFEASELIFHDGDLANRFYLIIEGKVALESLIKNGNPVVLQTIGKGELLGWSWLFPPYFWRLHARAWNVQMRFSFTALACANSAKPTTTSVTKCSGASPK